jgi:NAD(P)H dehydrogenase (quinone)
LNLLGDLVMFVVMGGSGRVGGRVVEILARAQLPVRAISRQVRGESRPNVEWAVADAFDPESLATAFKGATSVFVLNAISPDVSDVHKEASRLSASISAALLKASPPHVVALSSQGAQMPTGTGVVTTLNGFEAALRDTGLDITYLRPAFFMESWVPLALSAAETGVFPAFLNPPEKAVDAVSALDVGRIAAELLLAREPGVINITGPMRYSDEDAARICSDLLDRDVVTVPIPASEVAAAHEAVGLSPSYASAIAEMYGAINADNIPFEEANRSVSGKTTLKEVLGHGLSSVA